MVFSMLINLVLSNILVLDESVFINYISVLGYIWTGILLFFALEGLHMYSFKTNVFSILATVAGIVILAFLIFLMFNLFIQFFSFLETVTKELLYRIRVGF